METTPAIDPAPAHEVPDMLALVRTVAHSRGTTLRMLCKRMGRNHNFLNQTLRGNDPRISLLMELSTLLHYNFIEAYTILMPRHAAMTGVERELLGQNQQLQAELERTREERDRYWQVIAAKAGA